MLWEHHSQPIASHQTFIRRILRQFVFVLLLIVLTLIFGMLGYRILAGWPWIDGLLESAMFLSGAGPIYTQPDSPQALKLFSSFYALFCTLVVVSIVVITAAPVVHRALHRLHVDRPAR